MLVLGLESTCDETACAVVRDGREVLSSVVASQADLHNRYGGVVPELCCRHHVERVLPTVSMALQEAGCSLADIDLLAVAYAPGLVGALLIGLTAAKGLSLALGIPFVGVNHVEAHLYAAVMCGEGPEPFPALGAVLSGGHTALWHINGIGAYRLIGQTVDDAIGEAFDKAAKLLGLPYPGGPHIEALAQRGDGARYALRAGRVKEQPWSFSFSGLKTALLYLIKELTQDGAVSLGEQQKADLAASFQRAAFEAVVTKIAEAAHKYRLVDVVLGGGVTNNRHLRGLCAGRLPHLRWHWPSFAMSLDNAAMIAGLGYHVYRTQGASSLALEALPRLSLGD